MENVIHSYETMFIINPQLSEEETKAIVEKFKTLIEKGRAIAKVIGRGL